MCRDEKLELPFFFCNRITVKSLYLVYVRLGSSINLVDFDFKKKMPEFVCTRHLFDFVSRRECANSKEAFIFKSAYFVSKIQPLDNNDFISNNEKNCNIELKPIQCKKNHKSMCS